MSNYIKREDAIALIEAIKKANENEPQSEYHIGYTDALNYVIDTLYANEDNAISSADVEHVRHGHWECSDDIYETAICSECGCDTEEPYGFVTNSDEYNFCRNCGAKMDGEEQEHE